MYYIIRDIKRLEVHTFDPFFFSERKTLSKSNTENTSLRLRPFVHNMFRCLKSKSRSYMCILTENRTVVLLIARNEIVSYFFHVCEQVKTTFKKKYGYQDSIFKRISKSRNNDNYAFEYYSFLQV